VFLGIAFAGWICTRIDPVLRSAGPVSLWILAIGGLAALTLQLFAFWYSIWCCYLVWWLARAAGLARRRLVWGLPAIFISLVTAGW
jgi:hypothetical protein